MSRTGHRWHYEECPHCHKNEKVQNRSYRYVAPNNAVTLGFNSHGFGPHKFLEAGGELFPSDQFHRTTIHRLACAKKHGVPAFRS